MGILSDYSFCILFGIYIYCIVGIIIEIVHAKLLTGFHRSPVKTQHISQIHRNSSSNAIIV